MGIGSSLSFNFGGVWSYDMGVVNANVQDNGLFQDGFVADRELKEITVRHRKKPYFQRIQDNPLTLTLRLFFDNPFDNNSIRNVARWLCADEQYRELYFSDNEDRRFFAMYVGTGTKLQHNGNGEGYIDITMRCDAPYSYSPQYTETYDFSTNGGGTIEFENLGDASCYPEIQITKSGNNNGDISITNNSNGGQVFKLNGAKNGSTLLTIATNVVDGMTVQIGRDLYEFDTDNSVNATNIPVVVPVSDLSVPTAINALLNAINTSSSKVEDVTATVSSPNTLTITCNVLNETLPVGTNFPSVILWGANQIDGNGIIDQEQVYIDNDNQIILSSLSNTYRYDAFNNNYLELVTGTNYLVVQGYCTLEIRWRCITLQG